MIITPPKKLHEQPWFAVELAAGKLAIKEAGLNVRVWTETSEGIWSANVWCKGQLGDWKPRVWLVPQAAGLSWLMPGFIFGGVPLWVADGFRLDSKAETDPRKFLLQRLTEARRYLWCWYRMPFPSGCSIPLGQAVERYFTPWWSGDVPRHGQIWMQREPIEARGLTILQGLEEILEEEWERRMGREWDRQEATRALSKFYLWFKGAFKPPRILWEEAVVEVAQKELLPNRGKSYKSQRRKRYRALREASGKPMRPRSLISEETRRRLKAEPKSGMRNQGVNNAKSNQ